MSLNREREKSKPALGKGLASLLPNAATSGSTGTPASSNKSNAGSSSVGMSALQELQASSAVLAGTESLNAKDSISAADEKKDMATVVTTSLPESSQQLVKDAASIVATNPVDNTPAPISSKDRHIGIALCSIEDIGPNPFQPRRQFDDQSVEELAQSIRENGIIQPLVVRRHQRGYQLIAGERRWRAAKLAGLKQVPIVVRKTTDQEALELALIENLQREDLNCIDTALAYMQLMQEFDLTQEQVAQKVGKDRASVANHLRLLKLPGNIQGWLKQGTLTYGHGKALAGIEDLKLAEEFATRAVDERWSVRQLEFEIQTYKDGQKNSNPEEKKDESTSNPLGLRFANLSKELTTKLNARVRFQGSDQKGKIVLEYSQRQVLDGILDRLLK